MIPGQGASFFVGVAREGKTAVLGSSVPYTLPIDMQSAVQSKVRI